MIHFANTELSLHDIIVKRSIQYHSSSESEIRIRAGKWLRKI